MTGLFIFLCLLLTVVVLVQLGKVTELANSLKGEQEAEIDNNNRQGFLGLLFLVGFMLFCVVSMWYYKNWMLGYGPHDPASEHGGVLDDMFHTTFLVTFFVFVVTHIALFWYAWKYRGHPDRKALFMPHDTRLELVWTAVPSVVMCFLVVNGLIAWNDVMGDDLDEDIEIEATAAQFSWTLRYPGADNRLGTHSHKLISGINPLGQDWNDTKNLDDLHVDKLVLPVGKKVRVRIIAKDVLHNFDLPHFRVKMDAIPGLPTYFYFTPTITTEEYRQNLRKYPEYQAEDPNNPGKQLWETFEYDLACAELCGNGHYNMRKTVEIVDDKTYQNWLANQKSWYLSSVRNSAEDPYKGKLIDFEVKERSAAFGTNFDAALASTNVADKRLVLEYVTFKTGSAELTPLSKYQLDDLVNQLKKNPAVKILVGGHTDNVGSLEGNIALSQSRAATVAAYLAGKGITGDRYTAQGFGPNDPLGPNDTDENRAKNRRTDFKIVAQ